VPRLRALAQLDLDHLYLIIGCAIAKAIGIVATGIVAAAEIAAAKLPDDVAAVDAVVGAEAAFAGIVIKAAELRTPIERFDRVRAERSEAHRRNIE